MKQRASSIQECQNFIRKTFFLIKTRGNSYAALVHSLSVINTLGIEQHMMSLPVQSKVSKTIEFVLTGLCHLKTQADF
jgi:hypothetical protein